MKRETLDLAAAEVRFATTDEGIVSGYASVWDHVLPYHREMVARGAFTRSLTEHRAAGTRPVMLWSHNPNEPIGVWDGVAEDDRGLHVSGHILAETRRGAEVRALMAAGAINGLSIGFRTRKDRRGKDGVRVLQDVDIAEISLVAMPASPSARATYRSAAHDAPLAAFIQAAGRAALSIKKR